MSFEPLYMPAWTSFLVGVVLFFVRKWVADVAAAVGLLEERMRAYEKGQAECRIELVKGYASRVEMDRLADRLENHTTRLTILEERRHPH